MFYLVNRFGEYYTGHVSLGTPRFSKFKKDGIPLEESDLQAELALWVDWEHFGPLTREAQ